MAKQWGVANYSFLDIPHPIGNLTEGELNRLVDGMVDDVLKLFLEGQP